MGTLLSFTILGVFTGAAYAIAASGLVLTYSTTRVFNIAHGAVGMFAWSAAKLFVEKAQSLGGKLTRASLAAAIAGVHDWTAGGMHGPMDVGGKHSTKRRIERDPLDTARREIERGAESALGFVPIDNLEELFLLRHRARHPPLRLRQNPRCHRPRSRSRPRASLRKARRRRRPRSARPGRPRASRVRSRGGQPAS